METSTDQQINAAIEIAKNLLGTTVDMTAYRVRKNLGELRNTCFEYGTFALMFDNGQIVHQEPAVKTGRN